MEPVSLPITCQCNRAANCCSVSLNFSLEKQAFELTIKTNIVLIPIDSAPYLRDRILGTNKDQRRVLRREIERWINKPGLVTINDLQIHEISHGIMIRKAVGPDIILSTTCGCLRRYLLFQLSLLIGRMDDIDTKVFQLFVKAIP
jgi:hypothetical protein